MFNIAGAKDQALILTDFAREFVEDSLKLSQWIEPHRRHLKCASNNGVMRVLSAAGTLLHGLNPSAIFVDELHALMQPAQEEAYVAMVTTLHKRGGYQLAITTAGYDKDTILGRAYEESLRMQDGEDRLDGCLRIRRDRENGVLFYWYGIPENLHDQWRDEELWRLVNPASFVSIEELRKQLAVPGFHELDFQRLHCNMWTRSLAGWLPSGLWMSLRSDAKIPDGGDVYVMIDVGQYHDTTAVAWAHRIEDESAPNGFRIVVRARVWAVKQDQPHDVYVQGGRMRMDLIGEFLREKLAKQYRIREIVYDPALFAGEADRLADEGLPMYELGPGTTAMLEAYQSFYALAKEGGLTHNGDQVLATHVDSMAADMTERGWRVRKMKSTTVIDAGVAAVGAVYRAARQEAPSVYEKRGLFVLTEGMELEDELPDTDEWLGPDPEDLEPGDLDDDDDDDDDRYA